MRTLKHSLVVMRTSKNQNILLFYPIFLLVVQFVPKVFNFLIFIFCILLFISLLEQFAELHEQGVEHIINVSNIERKHGGFRCTFLSADDDQTESLNRLFYEVADIIEESEKKGEGVFVHCQRGLSRSPTLVMAYLMIKKNLSLREAFELVKRKRPNIGPRSNFMTQLCRLELELTNNGANLKYKEPNLLYSLPMQVYELSSMHCANYEESIDFLFSTKRKRGILQRYRNFLRTM